MAKLTKQIFFFTSIFLFLICSNQNAYAVEKASASSAMLTSKKPLSKSDNREEVLQAYLKKNDSPLISSSKTFVKYADTFDLDYRLLVAISGVESTFGKQIPANSYNAWGWGIYGDNRIYFKSWDDAIETISKGLREQYINKWNAQDVYQIGRLYAASPTWASRVEYFMNKITAFEVNNPDLALPISLQVSYN